MISRRFLLGTPLWAALGVEAAAQPQANRVDQDERTSASLPATPDIASGPFQPAVDSLKKYRAPAWFRDAKFGIWAHWGPQAVPRCGDWYARWMYVPGHPDYAHHLEHYATLRSSDTKTSFRFGRRRTSIRKP